MAQYMYSVLVLFTLAITVRSSPTTQTSTTFSESGPSTSTQATSTSTLVSLPCFCTLRNSTGYSRILLENGQISHVEIKYLQIGEGSCGFFDGKTHRFSVNSVSKLHYQLRTKGIDVFLDKAILNKSSKAMCDNQSLPDIDQTTSTTSRTISEMTIKTGRQETKSSFNKGSIDLEAMLDANKVLLVVFTFLIIALNLSLILKWKWHTKKSSTSLFSSQKKYIVCTLALADVFGAAYFLGYVNMSMAFGSDVSNPKRIFNVTCRDMFFNALYMNYLIPFVCSISIIVLSIEQHMRQTLREISSGPCCLSLFFGLIPWVVGLVLILPFCMIGFSLETCRYDPTLWTASHHRLRHVLTLIVPPILALSAAIISRVNKANPLPEHFNAATPKEETTLGSSGRPQNDTGREVRSEIFSSSPPLYPDLYPPTYDEYTENNHKQARLSSSRTLMLESSARRDQNTLIIVAALHFITTIPLALFSVISSLEIQALDTGDYSPLIWSLGLGWLFFLRPVLVPIVWMIS